MKLNILKISAILLIILSFALQISLASDTFDKPPLYSTAYPYIKYFLDRSLGSSSGFNGLTRSYQLYLGHNTQTEEDVIYYGAAAYDQDILGRICLENGLTTILDTYVNYFKQLSDPNNPLINVNNQYYDANFNPLNNGPYMMIRILGRDISGWWNTWNWIVDTGAASCLIIYALDGYQHTLNIDYKNLAIFFGDYILRLQDSDGGIRYGPRGMYHANGPDFYWNLKSTEQNERALCAFNALYQITNDTRYNQAANYLKNWLKTMYDKTVHLYYSAATFNGLGWVPTSFSYVATDVMAFTPIDLMFTDSYFGSTQAQRDQEIDLMFNAIEQRTAFFDSNNMPKLFRFSVSQTGDYGSVEWSAQMALAYLRVAQVYAQRPDMAKTQGYLNKYNALVANLDTYFTTPTDDAQARVCPYASYLDGSVAAGVPTGTGYYTYDCQAALASAYYAFAKAGFDPSKLGGGLGIPKAYCTLNMTEMPWYQNVAPYNSSGAASAQMIINYIRKGAVSPYSQLTQNQIYEYAKDPQPRTGELNAVQMDKTLGHFDPYDVLVSNSADTYDSLVDGNPFQGYNYSIDTYNPVSDPQALNKYMRDICHWMAYTVTKEEWWKDGELVAHPNTPAVIPIFGSYNHWVVVKGFAVNANPCPNPHTDPFNTPDFTVYGFWIKDPLSNGIGKDTYKTASECRSTYFLPLSSVDAYNGQYLQIAEPPAYKSKAKTGIAKPVIDLANLKFMGQGDPGILSQAARTRVASKPFLARKRNWADIVDQHLLSDQEARAAFDGKIMGQAVLVKRVDKKYFDYYLLPFGKLDKKGNFLASAVIILDANTGHFKEASWTRQPEKFLNVDKNQALVLIRKYLLDEIIITMKQRLTNKNRPIRLRELYREYEDVVRYAKYFKAELCWKPANLSQNPYKPYWKIQINWRIWYVSQDGKVVR